MISYLSSYGSCVTRLNLESEARYTLQSESHGSGQRGREMSCKWVQFRRDIAYRSWTVERDKDRGKGCGTLRRVSLLVYLDAAQNASH
jgi:hypothetical protein